MSEVRGIQVKKGFQRGYFGCTLSTGMRRMGAVG